MPAETTAPSVDRTQVMDLRRALAEALCMAQALPLPRTELQRMVYHLLATAFAGLDDDASSRDRLQAWTVALHALREWRALVAGSDQAVSAGAPF